MSVAAQAWSLLGAADRAAVSELAQAGAQLVQALGAAVSLPVVFPSSEVSTVESWEGAYSAAARIVNGPGLDVLLGTGSVPSAPSWSEVIAATREPAVQSAERALQRAHDAIRAANGVATTALSDAPLRAWLAARAARDAGTQPPVTTPVQPTGGSSGLAKLALAVGVAWLLTRRR